MKSIFRKTLTLIIAGIFGLSLLNCFAPAYATDICSNKDAVATEVWEAAGCNKNKNALPTIITIILNSIIAVSGLVAVVFVVIGGINYITSTGDASKLEKAKKTILYATIGLVICALSFAIVNWTISIFENSVGSGNTTSNTN